VEIHGQGGYEDPQILSRSFAFPARLIGIKGLGFDDVLSDLFGERLTRLRDPIDCITGSSEGDIDSEQREENFTDASACDAVYRGQIADSGMNPGAEIAVSHLVW
jgi:hypothetical protein